MYQVKTTLRYLERLNILIFCSNLGDRLCISDDNNLAGAGTYVYRNYIYAAIAGLIQVKYDDDERNQDSSLANDQLNVNQQSKTEHNNQLNEHKHRIIAVLHNVKVGLNRVPSVGVIVTCKILSINNALAKCQICCIEDNILKLPFKATLRKEDISSDIKDIIEVYKCFRPKDIILARIIGQSDQGYMLTTGEEELGVVIGYSDAGNLLSR